MAEKKSPYGGAPKRSVRSKLRSKGYEQLMMRGGIRTFSERDAKTHVERLHKQGHLARAVHITDPDLGNWWIVMFRVK